MKTSTIGLTPGEQIRLECVSLAYRHDRDTQTIIDRAMDFEEYVVGVQAEVSIGLKTSKASKGRQVGPDTDPI